MVMVSLRTTLAFVLAAVHGGAALLVVSRLGTDMERARSYAAQRREVF